MINQPLDAQNDERNQLMMLSVTKRDAETLPETPLRQQTAELIKILATRETGIIYKDAAVTTLNVLKALAVLLFQLLVTAFAFLIWLWGIGFQCGHYFREWIEVKSPSVSEVVCVVLQAIALPFVSLYNWAAAFVRASFGWEVQFNCLESGTDTTQPDNPNCKEPEPGGGAESEPESDKEQQPFAGEGTALAEE
ncbi:MAG: hypothetical protein F6K19_38205 [Cyanothece sp. SIO1E1]|nr:hypothetical protein [Cyanothece sp. SIO1E1]